MRTRKEGNALGLSAVDAEITAHFEELEDVQNRLEEKLREANTKYSELKDTVQPYRDKWIGLGGSPTPPEVFEIHQELYVLLDHLYALYQEEHDIVELVEQLERQTKEVDPSSAGESPTPTRRR